MLLACPGLFTSRIPGVVVDTLLLFIFIKFVLTVPVTLVLTVPGTLVSIIPGVVFDTAVLLIFVKFVLTVPKTFIS